MYRVLLLTPPPCFYSRKNLLLCDSLHSSQLSRRGPQPHMFWLFNDIMLYGDQKLDGSYKVNREIKLLKCQVSSPSDEELEAASKVGDENSEFSLSCMISIESDQKSFVAYAESKEEKTKWVSR